MKKIVLSVLFFSLIISAVSAQDEDKQEEKKGFKKENLFTGGSISLGFGSGIVVPGMNSNVITNTGNRTIFSIGASPMFGYSITKWLDGGIMINYNYQSVKNFYTEGDRIRQNQYGGGGFVKIYPVRFLYAQAQFEHNYITNKYKPGGGLSGVTQNSEANSVLVGAGYADRDPWEKKVFFYLSLLFDVSGVRNTPYTNESGNAIPIITGGVQIPLFQSRNGRDYEEQSQGNGGKRPRNYNRY